MANNTQNPRRSIPRVRGLRFDRIQKTIEKGDFPNATTLARLIEASPRAIKDDIAYLRLHHGHKIAFDASRNGYFYEEKVAPVTPVHATEGEITAVLVAQNAVKEFQGTFLEQPFQSALDKMMASLPERIVLSAEKWKDVISIHTTVRPILNGEIFRMLAEAAADRETLKMIYCKPGEEPSERLMDPYNIAKINGEWFIFAFDHLRKKHVTFVPIRIRSLTPTGKRFKKRRDFSLEKRLRESFLVHQGDEEHDVVIHFNKQVAQYIREKEWPCQQSQCELPNGAVELRLKLSSLGEIQRWLMQWGANAIVQQPGQLREMMAAAGRAIAAAYASAEPGGESAASPV